MVEDLSLYLPLLETERFFFSFSVFKYVTEVGKKSSSTKRTIGSPDLKKKQT